MSGSAKLTYELEAIINASTDKANNVMGIHIISISLLVIAYYIYYPYIGITIHQLFASTGIAGSPISSLFNIIVVTLPVIAIVIGALTSKKYGRPQLDYAMAFRRINENLLFTAIIGIALSIIGLSPPGLYLERLFGSIMDIVALGMVVAAFLMYLAAKILPIYINIYIVKDTARLQTADDIAAAIRDSGRSYKIDLEEIINNNSISLERNEALLIELGGSQYYVANTAIASRYSVISSIDAGDKKKGVGHKYVLVKPSRETTVSVNLPRLTGHKEVLTIKLKPSTPYIEALQKIPVKLNIVLSHKKKETIEAVYTPGSGSFVEFVKKAVREKMGDNVNLDKLEIYRDGIVRLRNPEKHIPSPGDEYDIYLEGRARAAPKIEIKSIQRATAVQKRSTPHRDGKMLGERKPAVSREDVLESVERLIEKYKELQGDLW